MADGSSHEQEPVMGLRPVNEAVKEIADNLSQYVPPKSIKVPCRSLEEKLRSIDQNTGTWVEGYRKGAQALILQAYAEGDSVKLSLLPRANYFSIKSDNEPPLVVLIKVTLVLQGRDGLYRWNPDISWVLLMSLDKSFSANNSMKIRIDVEEELIQLARRRGLEEKRYPLRGLRLIEISDSSTQIPDDLNFPLKMTYGDFTSLLSDSLSTLVRSCEGAFDNPEDTSEED